MDHVKVYIYIIFYVCIYKETLLSPTILALTKPLLAIAALLYIYIYYIIFCHKKLRMNEIEI